ncbi:hypothetical protein SAMN05443252_104119 [Bacillus sp. OV322]|nr:hypothetical protein SAMN05443252_104119 [Bacillus sp. OV322]
MGKTNISPYIIHLKTVFLPNYIISLPLFKISNLSSSLEEYILHEMPWNIR